MDNNDSIDYITWYHGLSKRICRNHEQVLQRLECKYWNECKNHRDDFRKLYRKVFYKRPGYPNHNNHSVPKIKIHIEMQGVLGDGRAREK